MYRDENSEQTAHSRSLGIASRLIIKLIVRGKRSKVFFSRDASDTADRNERQSQLVNAGDVSPEVHGGSKASRTRLPFRAASSRIYRDAARWTRVGPSKMRMRPRLARRGDGVLITDAPRSFCKP